MELAKMASGIHSFSLIPTQIQRTGPGRTRANGLGSDLSTAGRIVEGLEMDNGSVSSYGSWLSPLPLRQPGIGVPVSIMATSHYLYKSQGQSGRSWTKGALDHGPFSQPTDQHEQILPALPPERRRARPGGAERPHPP